MGLSTDAIEARVAVILRVRGQDERHFEEIEAEGDTELASKVKAADRAHLTLSYLGVGLLPRLLELLGQRSWYVARLFGRIGEPAINPLCEHWEDPARRDDIERALTEIMNLREIGSPKDLEAYSVMRGMNLQTYLESLRHQSQDTNTLERLRVIHQLSADYHPLSIPLLVPRLQDDNPYVVLAAAHALARTGHPDALPPLQQAVTQASPDLHWFLTYALELVNAPQRMQFYTTLLQSLEDVQRGLKRDSDTWRLARWRVQLTKQSIRLMGPKLSYWS